MTLPETCDFCDLVPDEDESMVEVRFGSVPQPDMIRLEGTDAQYRKENNIQAQGRLLAELMKEHSLFDVQLHDYVEEIRAVGGDTHFHSSSGNTDISVGRHESHYDDDKVGVRVSVYPEAVESEPDAHLCEGCAAMLGYQS